MTVITDHRLFVYPQEKTIRGRGLGSRKLSKPARALLAADVASGKVQLGDFSERQLALLLNVSVPYIRAARGLSDAQRYAVEHGFRPLVRPTTATARAQQQLYRIVSQFGVNATLDLLASTEQATA